MHRSEVGSDATPLRVANATCSICYMRNAEVINAISAKIAAHVSEISGQTVTPITTDDLDPHPYDVDRFLSYYEAFRSDTTDLVALAAARKDLDRAVDRLTLYVQESLIDPATVTLPDVTNMDYDLPDGTHPTPEEWQTAAEDWGYGLIPARYLPDGPRTDEARAEARITLYQVWATKSLAEWSRVNAQRDSVVRAAYEAGVPKTRIHLETGIARSTIDRIIG